MNRSPWFAGIFSVLVSSATALDWPTTVVEARAAPFQTTVEVSFAFQNVGTQPVTLRNIQSNCDCLAVASDRRVYQPGESGRLTAKFTVGDRIGRHERTIHVVSDDAATPTLLSVRIEVPELATVEPRGVDWPIGAVDNEKALVLRVADGLWIEFTEASPTNARFAARLECVEPGRHYRLLLKPTGTATAANAAIRVAGRDKAGRSVLISAYANVR
jgi:hypothetical protein